MKYFIKLFIVCLVAEFAFASSVSAQCDAQAFASELERQSLNDAKKMASAYFLEHVEEAYKNQNDCMRLAGRVITYDIPVNEQYGLPARFADAITLD